jgi:hypothetical protein
MPVTLPGFGVGIFDTPTHLATESHIVRQLSTPLVMEVKRAGSLRRAWTFSGAAVVIS